MHTSNLIAYAVPVFTFMILCEFIYGYFRNKNNYRLNDTFTSIGLAIFFIHILEIVIFWKRIKNNPIEGIVMTFVFGYVYIRGLRK